MSKTPAPSHTDRPTPQLAIIPDLCQINALLLMLILTQMLAFILTLMQSGTAFVSWELLGQISIFSHFLVLSCAALICSSRRLLYRQSVAIQVTAVLLVVLAVSGSFAAFVVVELRFLVNSPSAVFILRCMLISMLISILMLRYFALQAQWRNQKQAELKARIEALQARIRPHFLFNSMNAIASLIASDPDRAEDAVVDLASVFRMTLNTNETTIPLKEEIALCRRFLNLESLRLGDRLKIDWQLEGLEDEIMVPPLILQPLVENAIYHGIQPLAEGGTITIQTYCTDKRLSVLISNPYPPEREGRHGNQIALDNIRARLSALYDDDAILKISQHKQVFTVVLRLPLKLPEQR